MTYIKSIINMIGCQSSCPITSLLSEPIGCYPGGHCWGYYLGTMWWWHALKSLEFIWSSATHRFHLGVLILKWVAKTWLGHRPPVSWWWLVGWLIAWLIDWSSAMQALVPLLVPVMSTRVTCPVTQFSWDHIQDLPMTSWRPSMMLAVWGFLFSPTFEQLQWKKRKQILKRYLPYTVECRYSVVQYDMIFHTPLYWLMQNINLTLKSHKRHSIPHPHGRAMACLLWGLGRNLAVLWQHCTVYKVISISSGHFSLKNLNSLIPGRSRCDLN